MKYITLDKDEEKIESAYDSSKYKSLADKKVLNNYQKIAQSTLDKTKNINIRLTEKDLLKIKAKSAEKGLPYQTLISSVLHQYLSSK